MKPLIEITQKYKSSTRIDSTNIDYKTFIDDFIVHGTVQHTLETLGREYSANSQRAFTITGTYGSGKSTFALFLSSLLSSDKSICRLADAKLKDKNIETTGIKQNFGYKKGWQTIKHVCGMEPPAQAILASVSEAFGVKASQETIDEAQALEALRSLLSSNGDKQDGVIILLDEMGKALDYLAKNNGDLHLFQTLADIIQQSDNPILLIGFLHQSFQDYALSKDIGTQKEWAKVQGRYRDLGFNPTIDESLVLIGDSIGKDKKLYNELVNKRSSSVKAVIQTFKSQAKNSGPISSALPLSPLVSILLGPISRRRFSQNERSLFGFLASQEKHGFREFLTEHYQTLNDELPLYTTSKLWDYLHYNLHHVITSSQDSKPWLEGCDAVYRAQQKGSDLHTSIAKTIGLLTIFGFHHHLYAKEEFIVEYFAALGYPGKDVRSAVADLNDWSIIIFRPQHGAWFIFQGSDIDIHQLTDSKIESLQHGVDWTTVCHSNHAILATRHYHQTGTMRWAKTLVVGKIDKTFESALKSNITPVTGEAFITLLLPANEKIFDQLNKKYANSLPIAIGRTDNIEKLKNAAIEVIALQSIEKDERRIQHDPIAKKELENRSLIAKHTLDSLLIELFNDANWFYKNNKLPKNSLSSTVSNLADQVYTKKIIAINELVNRSKPSGNANSAIRKVMDRILKASDAEDLGFEGDSFPPEKGVYLSCIKGKGFHQKTEEGYRFPSQWDEEAIKANPDTYTLLQDTIIYVKEHSKVGHVTMEDIYALWMRAPYGLTIGLCRLFGLALLKSLEGHLAYYDQDSSGQYIFIPELDEELIDKLYKHPKEAAIRYYEHSQIEGQLIKTLAKATLNNSNAIDDAVILNIAKHIVKIIHKLPAWVKKTSGDIFSSQIGSFGLTSNARDLRNKVISAHDPYELILKELPQVFGVNVEQKNSDELISNKLNAAIEELLSQHAQLLDSFKLLLEEGLAGELNEELKERCQLVLENAQRPKVKELAGRIIQVIDGHQKLEFVISLAAGVVDKNWTDKHLRSAYDELQNLCLQFRRAEAFANAAKGGSVRPVAVITSDENGNYKEYSGFIEASFEKDSEYTKTLQQLQSGVKNLSKEKQVALLSQLMSDIVNTGEKEVSYEG
ncbi:hypothetical protein [Alkalimarinus alittae]|uniref:AAA+ ATPase domain-containing protein n=1 Tax=Alkalimarinus alittae TaxID=2961619 RepID=A0ABY6N497_9ALTE|nr:hypothetical protein [Alkalimarinus alittae]UZE96817.1 hypothetical protein NKI27_03430 [Alkalimarinus alittae]